MMLKRLNSQSGMSLMSVITSLSILGIIAVAIITVAVDVKKQTVSESRAIQIRIILLELISHLSTNSAAYPAADISGQPAVYVMCYTDKGVRVPFTDNKMIKVFAKNIITHSEDASAIPQCPTNIEARVSASPAVGTSASLIEVSVYQKKSGLETHFEKSKSLTYYQFN